MVNTNWLLSDVIYRSLRCRFCITVFLSLGVVSCSDQTLTATQSTEQSGETAAEKLVGEALTLIDRENHSEPEDPCDLSNNWKYGVLSRLSRAMELDPAGTATIIDSPDVYDELASLGTVFEKWRLAIPRQWNSVGINELMTDREWWPYRNEFPPSWVETRRDGSVVRVDFLGEETALGSWQIDGEDIIMSIPASGSLPLRVNSIRYAFDQGKSWFFVAALETDSTDAQLPWSNPLIVGPRSGDCGDYNF